jgi:hypothetical protein
MAILMLMLYLATVSAFSVKVAVKIGSMKAFFLAAASYLALHIPYTGGLVVGMLIPVGRTRPRGGDAPLRADFLPQQIGVSSSRILPRIMANHELELISDRNASPPDRFSGNRDASK